MKNKCGYGICCHPFNKKNIGCEACHFWRQLSMMDTIKVEQDNEKMAKNTQT